MSTLIATLGSVPRNKLIGIIGSCYLFAIITISIFIGLSPLLYFAFLAIAVLCLIPSYTTGFKLILLMTMIFERFFTLGSLVIGQQEYKIYPLDIVIIITAISWMIYLWRHKSTVQMVWGWPEKLMFIFLLIGFLNFVRSFADVNAGFDTAFSSLKNYVFYPLLYFLTIYSIRSKKEFKDIMNVIILGGGAIIGFIVYGFAAGGGLWTEFTPLSTTGVRYLAGTHAFYLILAIMIMLALIIFKKIKHPILAWGLIWIWLLGIVGSLMRHLWLGLGIGLIITLIALPIKNKKILTSHSVKNTLLVLSIVATLILTINILPDLSIADSIDTSISGVSSRAASITNTQNDTSATWRLDLWRSARNAWMTNPIVGIGFGKSIPLESGDYKTYEEVRNIHNSPLAITVQMGILGILALGAFGLAVIVYSWRKMFADEKLTPYYIGLMAGTHIFVFASLFQPYLETNLTGIFLWIMLGLLRTSEVFNKKTSNEKLTNV